MVLSQRDYRRQCIRSRTRSPDWPTGHQAISTDAHRVACCRLSTTCVLRTEKRLSGRWSAAAVVLSSARSDRVSPASWADVTVAGRAVGCRLVAWVARPTSAPLTCQTVPVAVQIVGIDSRTACQAVEPLRRGSAVEVTAIYITVPSSRGGIFGAVQGGPVILRRSTSYRQDKQYQAKAAAHYRPLC